MPEQGPFAVRFRLPCPPDSGVKSWGDYHFALSLTKSLRKLGHRVILDFATGRGNGQPVSRWVWRRKWTSFRTRFLQPVDVDLILRGNVRYDPLPGRPYVMWLISNSRSVAADELSGAAHVFVASGAHAAALTAAGHGNVSVLLQCTDPAYFSPDLAKAALRSPGLFVGNKRKFERASVTYALQADIPVQIWGRGWGGIVPAVKIGGIHIPNAQLGRYYGSAAFVLNDHAPDMAADGFASNRVFDVLASGVPLVSDAVPDLPAELASAVYQFDSCASFVAACDRAGSETDAQKQARLQIAAVVRRDHSFDARAKVIETEILKILRNRAGV